jgi:hypothetical protein
LSGFSPGIHEFHEQLSEPQRQAVERLARQVTRLGLSPVAILFIESSRPLNFVGSQLLHFFAPMIQAFGKFQDYQAIAELLEDRRSVDYLLEAIEREEAKADAAA